MWPQIVWIVLASAYLAISAVHHGHPRNSTWNFWSGLLSLTISFAILYFGGFFDPFLGIDHCQN